MTLPARPTTAQETRSHAAAGRFVPPLLHPEDANAGLHTVATLLYDLVLDSGTVLMPDHPEGWARAQVRAALAELRFLQGFFTSLTAEADGASLSQDTVVDAT